MIAQERNDEESLIYFTPKPSPQYSELSGVSVWPPPSPQNSELSGVSVWPPQNPTKFRIKWGFYMASTKPPKIQN